MDKITGLRINILLIAAGAILAFGLLAFVNKFELFGAVCYYVGSFSLSTTCIAPWVYYLAWAISIAMLGAGILQTVRQQSHPTQG